MTSLLVASGGGHLQQLVQLAPRLALGDELLWVTYDTLQARSLFGEAMVAAHHPTTKNVANAVRNVRLARRVFQRHSIDRVVSTGAAVAVPFMAIASQRGVPCHYIESATRVAGPSLSGRILQLLPSINLYRQTGSWGTGRWRPGPSVFDGFSTSRTDAPNIRRVLVSLGTHDFAFSRLVHRVFDVLGDTEVEVVWQLGSTPAPRNLPGRVEQGLTSAEFDALVRTSDVVVGHAGTGFTLTALSCGRVPVLVPRSHRHGEHTDDHQTELAQYLESRGLAVAADASSVGWNHFQQAARLVVKAEDSPVFPLIG